MFRQIPREREITKHFMSDLFRSAPPFSLVASIPQSGYVPGQTIVVSATVANNSSVSISAIKFTLCNTITYISSRPRNKKRRVTVLSKHKEPGLAPRSTDQFQAALSVPPVAPSNQGISKVINIEYWIKVEAKAAGPHFSPSVIIPITIGTIPLTSIEMSGSQRFALDQSIPSFPVSPPVLRVFDSQPPAEGIGGADVFPWESLDTGKAEFIIYLENSDHN